MATLKAVKAGDQCPIDGGAFVVDVEQHPDTLVHSKQLNEVMTGAAARFERIARAKADEEGVIHKCVTCGYRARFKDDDQEQRDREQHDREQQERDRANSDRRDREQREQRDQGERDREQRARESSSADAAAGDSASGGGSSAPPPGRRRAT